MDWYKTHTDIVTLQQLAGWKPWETKQLSVRERRFWADVYKAIEERRVLDDVTRPA